MKRIIAVLLIACLCFSIAACGTNENKPTSIESDNNSQTTEASKAELTETVIDTGLTIGELKEFAIGDAEEYTENIIENNIAEFSFSTTFEKWSGKLSGENVIEFTIEIEKVTATTKEEFQGLAYYGFTDFGKLSWNQVPSAFSIMYIMNGFVMLGGSGEITMDDAAGVLLNGETLTTGNWSLSATFDDSADNVKIMGIYQE